MCMIHASGLPLTYLSYWMMETGPGVLVMIPCAAGWRSCGRENVRVMNMGP